MENKDILYPIVEIFESIEGEGIRAGYMATFIRLAGCNLRCSYCDTEYAQREDDFIVMMSIKNILTQVIAYGWKRVTITGGEPLMHNLTPLLDELSARKIEVNIETNGSKEIPTHYYDNYVFYTMDWKSPSSEMNRYMLKSNFATLTRKDVVKFVVGCADDLDEMARVVEEIKEQATKSWQMNIPYFYVSPIWGEIEPCDIVTYLRTQKLEDVRLQLQIHKIIWDASKRGV